MTPFYAYIKELNRVLLGLAIQCKDYPNTVEEMKEDINFLASQNWQVFEFTQENVEMLYKNLSYSTVKDIMSFAHNHDLDSAIDYNKIKEIIEEQQER